MDPTDKDDPPDPSDSNGDPNGDPGAEAQEIAGISFEAESPGDASPEPLSPELTSSGIPSPGFSAPEEPAFDPSALEAVADPAASEDPAEDPAVAEIPPQEGDSEQPEAHAAESPPEAAPAERDAIQKVRDFSDQVPMENVHVPAAFPFSLLIEGELPPNEREKLLDVLSRENIGVREVDLEPQFEGGRVLIPRISEFAGVLLVQALRGTSARMKLGPSDSIFSTEDTNFATDPVQLGGPQPLIVIHGPPEEFNHPAEAMPVTAGESFPQFAGFPVLDTIFASTLLTSIAVEAQHTPEYQEILENLTRDLKFKAHRKGAAGIVKLQIDLRALTLGTQYRLTLSGSLVFAPTPEPEKPLPPDLTH